jgi:hypothetical protein
MLLVVPCGRAVAWGDVPTWIQAIATVLALIAASVAAVVAWKVLGVERRRDRQRQGAEERAQAEKVAAWPSVVRTDPADPNSAPKWGAAVRNASDLPVYQVHVEYRPITPGRGQMAIVSEVVPPGDWRPSGRELYPSETRYPNPSVYPGGSTLRRAAQDDLPDRNFVISLRFTDAANRVWHRDRYGVLTRVQQSGP